MSSHLSQLDSSVFEELANKKMYFGHQSVGGNLIDGIRICGEALGECDIHVKEMESIQDLGKVNFLHSKIGKNGDPISKIKEFKSILLTGNAAELDMAFMKLCYWDIRNNTDIKEVFTYYEQANKEINNRYPKIVIAHFTVPLMACVGGLRSKIKKLIGMPIEFELDNVKRNEFNKLILDKYDEKGYVFDIARAESTLQNGEESLFTYQGKIFRCLANMYTNDGGHLNDEGKQWVAQKYLVAMAKWLVNR